MCCAACVAERIPLNGGCLEPVAIAVPRGSLLDPPRGSAVSGGNVETSQRVVDVLLGALGRAAASQGTMNNVAFGDATFGYYETIGGGAGAGPDFDGASGVHTHMTNTRITEPSCSRRVTRCGSSRSRCGADRAERGAIAAATESCGAIDFLAPITASLLTGAARIRTLRSRRRRPGARGRNAIVRGDGRVEELPSRAVIATRTRRRARDRDAGGGRLRTARRRMTLAPTAMAL
jgi:5-oxoprolinase (ATP-hydrolysing)